MKRGNLLVICVAAMLSLFGAGVLLFRTNIEQRDNSVFSRTVLIGEREYFLEIAASNTERKRGLSGREGLCQECGMLFVFPQPGRYAFWMKDMRFSLDIIWLLDYEVVFVAHSVESDFSGSIEPGVVADRVIEVNAGAASILKVGERVEFLR